MDWSRRTKEECAREWGVPEGYSLKNWDPDEVPVVLLGSVFDANSLGKYIFDWTVYTFGALSSMADVAGDFWLLMIELAGKTKRAREGATRVGDVRLRETAKDFVGSGERLWSDLEELVDTCSVYMWDGRSWRNTGAKAIGEKAGTELASSMFGRDRQLSETEKLMSRVRLWSTRFDANCGESLLSREAGGDGRGGSRSGKGGVRRSRSTEMWPFRRQWDEEDGEQQWRRVSGRTNT